MASENEAVVRRLIDEIVADQYIRRDAALPRPAVGRAELKDQVRLYRDAFPDLNVVIEDMVTSDDVVTLRWRASGTRTRTRFRPVTSDRLLVAPSPISSPRWE